MNNLQQMYKAMQSGNPTQVFQMMAKNNPNMQPVLKLLDNGMDPKDIFYKMCQQRGINPDEFLKNITG